MGALWERNRLAFIRPKTYNRGKTPETAFRAASLSTLAYPRHRHDFRSAQTLRAGLRIRLNEYRSPSSPATFCHRARRSAFSAFGVRRGARQARSFPPAFLDQPWPRLGFLLAWFA